MNWREKVHTIGMSRRDMKVGQIETKMVGIDRKALGQIFEDFLWFIKLKNSVQITQQSLSNIQDVAVPENDHQNTERCMPVSNNVQIHDFSPTAYVSHWVHKTRHLYQNVSFRHCISLLVCIPGAKSSHNPHRSAIMSQSRCSDAMPRKYFVGQIHRLWTTYSKSIS